MTKPVRRLIDCGFITVVIALPECKKKDPAVLRTLQREVFYEKVLSALVLFYVLIISGTPSQNCHTKKVPKIPKSLSYDLLTPMPAL